MRNFFNKGLGFAIACYGSLKLITQATMKPYRLKRLYHFINQFNEFLSHEDGFSVPNSEKIQQLHRTTLGLHRLMPHSPLFSYSILIPVYKPKAIYFKMALESALAQTAPQMEVLVGFDGPQPDDVYQVVEEMKKQYPTTLKSFQLDRKTEGGSISASTNSLAKHASGNFLLLMDHDDWISPDLLYRYEQTLRRTTKPENFVLYCNEYKIDENSNPIPRTGVDKPSLPDFPYIFHNWICHCLLVPKALWKQVGGLRVECNGAQDYDLSLRLELAGANFLNVPFYLYAWRSHSQSTAQNPNQKSYAETSGIRALEDYYKAKRLDWKLDTGYLSTTYRALPSISKKPVVHVLIPYRDEKEMTLRSVRHVLNQQNVTVKVTAIDNNSKDFSIAEQLKTQHVEVIPIHESFNYSRLNNQGIKKSFQSDPEDLVLFLHNDVILKQNALEEMCRWIYQPNIGMVGARLMYPNGRLQHGGIQIINKKSESTEKGLPFEQLFHSRVLRLVDAVSTACALIKKDTFIKMGGFDEIWHPIINSDVNLAMRLQSRGLHCFYTPFAEGIHYELNPHSKVDSRHEI